MTAIVDRDLLTHRDPGRRRRVLALASVEARRTMRSPWLWLGVAGFAYVVTSTLDTDFQAGSYSTVVASFSVLALAVFVIAVQAGARDRAGLTAPLAMEAVGGQDERATARLLGLWPAVAVGVLSTVVVGVIERVEGGMWVGDWPRRTDTAVHSVLELLQPPALVLLAAASGVAIGRATAQRALVSALGAVVFGAFGLVYWAWQWSPARYLALVQSQPVEVVLARSTYPYTVPQHWQLAAPTEFDRSWRRVIIHEAMAGWHSAYLVGLAVVFAGLAMRRRRGWMLVGVGVLVAVIAVTAQVLVAPSGSA